MWVQRNLHGLRGGAEGRGGLTACWPGPWVGVWWGSRSDSVIYGLVSGQARPFNAMYMSSVSAVS